MEIILVPKIEHELYQFRQITLLVYNPNKINVKKNINGKLNLQGGFLMFSHRLANKIQFKLSLYFKQCLNY